MQENAEDIKDNSENIEAGEKGKNTKVAKLSSVSTDKVSDTEKGNTAREGTNPAIQGKEADAEGDNASLKEAKTEVEEKAAKAKEIRTLFNENFGKHLERLLGTKLAIEGLPMNLSTVSTLVLLAMRETEIESFPYLPPPRYDHEKLHKELAEISVESREETAAEINAMIEKGYIEVADDGRFFAKDPIISMVKLIDRIFPNMPGLNLIAYFGQMMDEVFFGRKSVKDAAAQFNQMLEIQGVPINTDKASMKQAKKFFPHLKEGGTTPIGSKQKRSFTNQLIKPSNILSRLQTTGRTSETTEQMTSSAPASDYQEPVEQEEEYPATEILEDTNEEDVNTGDIDLTSQLSEPPTKTVSEPPKDEPEKEEIEEYGVESSEESTPSENIKPPLFDDSDEDGTTPPRRVIKRKRRLIRRKRQF